MVPQRRPLDWSQVLVGTLMLGLILIGGYFRFVGLNWDDFTHLHPDERFLTSVAASIGRELNLSEPNAVARDQQYADCRARYPETNGVGAYFDTQCSTLNPHNANASTGLYVYGTLPLFMAKGAGEFMVTASNWWARTVLAPLTGDDAWLTHDASYWTRYDGIHLVWRFLSALAEMSIIVIVFLIGQRLHDKWIGLLAAFLYSATVFSIQMAHFGTVDAIANLFVALSLLFAVLVQREGRLINYLFFGIFFGAAVASRINLAPLAGVVVLAALLRVLPIFDRRLAPGEGGRLFAMNFLGLVIAGSVSILVFRIFNPYAFPGPGFFDVFPLNPRWLDNMETAQSLVSGAVDSPPNFQWVARAPYLFPLNNMILWGMGLLLGIVAWVSWGWAGWRLVRGRPGAVLNILLFAWILVYFGWLGSNWVSTMRYFLPIYPALIVLAAWGLVTLLRATRGRRLPRIGVGVVLAGVIGFTALWAVMFTNIYRNQLTRVQASHWVWENVPGDFAMRIDGAPASTPLINIALPNRLGGVEEDITTRVTRLDEFSPRSVNSFVPAASGTLSTIHAPHLGDPLDDPEPETLRFTITRAGDPTPLAEAELSTNLVRDDHPLGRSYDIPLNIPIPIEAGAEYTFIVDLVEGGPVLSGGSVFTWEGAWDDPVPTKVCAYPSGITLADSPPPGLASVAGGCRGLDPWWALVNGYLQNIVYEDVPAKRDVLIRTLNNSDYIAISSNRFYDTLSRNPERWPMTNRYYDALFNGELGYDLVAMFQETFELGPLRVSDQYLPIYDGPEWLNEFEAEEAFHVYDHPVVFIFQQRDDYDPDVVKDILFEVPLNRDTAAVVNRNCEGPGSETFYCDPMLAGVVPLSSELADQAPTRLRFTDEMQAIQFGNGTWSARFDGNSTVNSHAVITVTVWWLAVVLFGWAVWPLLFVAFPGLADRGYGLAKFTGIFLVAWGTWYLASLRIPAWNQIGVAVGLLMLGVISLLVVWRTRDRLVRYLRVNWRRLLAIEAITLVVFLAFLGLRLSNPDLWHNSFGGEKPMDFAYFNAVLRSTIFPPIDPWNAGGFINYYYFGFVITGAPVLLLGIIPSVAYNLLIPTLAALTGIGAFSVAFNVVSALRRRNSTVRSDSETADNVYLIDEIDDLDTPQTALTSRRRSMRRLGSPWVAGIAALLLAVVLGNLDTPRVFLTGVAQMGGYQQPAGMQSYLVERYTEENGAPPEGQALTEIALRSNDPPIADQVGYELGNIADLGESLALGFNALLRGEPLNVRADRWFWGPSRILAETPGVGGNAITEMPIFTFIYGDLHAHMIAMPMQVFVMAWLLNALLLAGRERQTRLSLLLALALGAITVGMTQATNTWEWITYTLLGAVGLAVAWWLGQRALATRPISRQGLLRAVGWVGGFLLISVVAALPYTTWFATAFNAVSEWEGGKTPLWAYFSIHGLFLFLLYSLLVWDTLRWLRSVHVRSLRGAFWYLIIGLVILGAVVVGALALTIIEYQVTLIALPLLVWMAVLLLRANQTRTMQFVLLLSGLAVGLTLGVEYIVLSGDIGRQNTVFKFYIQAWLLLSVVGGAAFAWLLRAWAQWRPGLRVVWGGALAILVFTAALFPIMAARGKAVYRLAEDQPLTLDGMDFMLYASHYEGSSQLLALYPERAPFSLADDHAMIRWLQENVEGTPIIMEGQSDPSEYKWNGRISIYTGMPSVIGWNWHQRQQRGLERMGRMVELRSANVNAFYHTQNIELAWDMLQYYDVTYVIVGNLEHVYYAPQSLAKFDQMVTLGLLDVVFEQNDSRIYRVNRDADLLETVAGDQG
ncbi:MAG: hypothetical protein GYB67_03285 [Chloroflexi bacterium]|nr:hypothetical protein [Chloroflexota bacterium]